VFAEDLTCRKPDPQELSTYPHDREAWRLVEIAQQSIRRRKPDAL
jgi:hypothetical protein